MRTMRQARLVKTTIGLLALAGTLLGGAPAFANGDTGTGTDNNQDASGTVFIDGRTFGPEDGVEVTEEWVVLPEPGSGGTVGVEWPSTPPPGMVTPMVYWGSSYAYSTETAWVWYEGHAKAAANVYSGQRIIQVCIQFQRSGVGIADKRCSSASSNGSYWSSGPDVVSYATDSLGFDDPQTIMYIWTTRINPQIL